MKRILGGRIIRKVTAINEIRITIKYAVNQVKKSIEIVIITQQIEINFLTGLDNQDLGTAILEVLSGYPSTAM